MVLGRNQAGNTTGLTGSTEQIQGGDGPFTGTLKAAVALGIPMKCDYEVTDEEGNKYQFTGTVKGRQWRGQFQTEESKTGEVILKDSCMWTWTLEEKQGFTTCVEPEEGRDIWDFSGEEQVDAPELNMRCLPTTAGDAEFTPPVDVQFVDLQETLKNLGAPAGAGTNQGQPVIPEDLPQIQPEDVVTE
jgi:hypothetical protein